MRYTRYNYRRRRNNLPIKMLVTLMVMLLIAFAIGRGIVSLWPEQGEKSAPIAEDGQGVKNNQDNKNQEYMIFQAGFYSKVENAEEANQRLSEKHNSFIAEDSGKFRVIAAVARAKDAEKLASEFNASGVAFVKHSAIIDRIDLCNEEIIESIEALMQVYETLQDGQVVSVNTQELKKWSSELKAPENNSKNILILEELNNYIKALPEEIKKEQRIELLKFMYSIIVKFKA